MKLTLVEKREETPDVTTFVFEPEQPLTWIAGQFLHYTLPHSSIDDRGEKRWFTISSAPFEKQVQITTRHAEKGSSFKKNLFEMPVGSVIEADGLEGDFVVENPAAELVFIAGGIGITPFRSILADFDHRGIDTKVTLLYANRDEHFVFKDELDALAKKHQNFRVHYFTPAMPFGEKEIAEYLSKLTQPIVYISGPEPMVESYEKILANIGVSKEHVKTDFFPGYKWA